MSQGLIKLPGATKAEPDSSMDRSTQARLVAIVDELERLQSVDEPTPTEYKDLLDWALIVQARIDAACSTH